MPTIGVSASRDSKAFLYCRSVEQVGGVPRLLQPGTGASREALLGSVQGLLLTGGTDLDPALYREQPAPETQPPDRERDAMEMDLIRLALETDMPILAICRGLQALNVALGGKLVQHMEGHQAQNGDSAFHEVFIAPGSRLAAVTGRIMLRVNSRHHQGVRQPQLAPKLRASAYTTTDGIIEGVECLERRWVLGVQWHPERDEGGQPFREASRRLFAALVQSARGQAGPG